LLAQLAARKVDFDVAKTDNSPRLGNNIHESLLLGTPLVKFPLV